MDAGQLHDIASDVVDDTSRTVHYIFLERIVLVGDTVENSDADGFYLYSGLGVSYIPHRSVVFTSSCDRESASVMDDLVVEYLKNGRV